ncbi:MAG: CHAT domain-containing protein [Actinomycetota bacterium]
MSVSLADDLQLTVSADRRRGKFSVTVRVSNRGTVPVYVVPVLMGPAGPRAEHSQEVIAIEADQSWSFTLEPAEDDEGVGVVASTSPGTRDSQQFMVDDESAVWVIRDFPGESISSAVSEGGPGMETHDAVHLEPDWSDEAPQARHERRQSSGRRPRIRGRIRADAKSAPIPIPPMAPPPMPSPPDAGADAVTAESAPPMAAPPDAGAGAETAEHAVPAPSTREVFGDIKAPGRAVVAEEFELEVGLADVASPGVAAAAFEIPTEGTTLELQVIAPGFQLRDGESWRTTLTTSHDDPFPKIVLHLTPDPISEDVHVRSIDVTYALDGEVIGYASRYVTVASSSATPARPEAPDRPMSLPLRTSSEKPDLTITISRPKGGGVGGYQLTMTSPHTVELPDAPEEIDLGEEALGFAERQIEQVKAVENSDEVFRLLCGRGADIARELPDTLWRVLPELQAQVGARPLNVLLQTAEPYVPWELAYMSDLIEPSRPPFLGAQVVLGRWPLDKPPPPAQPSDRLSVSRLCVISGVYDNPEFPRLEGAESEATTLAQEFGAVPVDALKPAVYSALESEPPNDIVHFAIHGKFNHQGYQNGLIMIDKRVITPDLIKGTRIQGTPFVFLNACQVGTSDEVLGNYSGMAHAFLVKGASGVVAPLWSISDTLAAEISVEFYKRVLNAGEAPAAVMWDIRGRFSEATTTSAFMAYQFFGHPTLRLQKEAVP